MSVDCFLDTNVLVYAAGGRDGEESKRNRALQLIADQRFGTSAQVMQEFYVTVTSKFAVPMSAAHALEWIEELGTFPCLAVDIDLVKIAAEQSMRYQISYWDGAIVAAADALGAKTLYSEDLNHGQQYGSVQVRNPFLPE